MVSEKGKGLDLETKPLLPQILLSSPRGRPNSYSLEICVRFTRSKEPSRNGTSNSCTKEVCDDYKKRITIQLSMATRLRVYRKFHNFAQ